MNQDQEPGNATILRFPKKAGRPKSTRPKFDSGTPELAMKRARGETAEALDLCLERGIISPPQHWCGVHLRWLYTLRHGAPGVRAIDLTASHGTDCKNDDPEWRAEREMEYHDAVKLLLQAGTSGAVLNLCVYNERPAFLSLKAPITSEQLEAAEVALCNLRNGLDLLVKLWRRAERN